MNKRLRSFLARLINRSRGDQSRPSDAGDTLIEVLIAIVVLGLTGIAMVAGFTTSILGASTHRGLATMDTILANATQEATAAIQSSASGSSSAFLCSNQPFSVSFDFGPNNANYSASITGIQYWTGANPTPTPNPLPQWQSTCESYAPQKITITVTDKGTSASASTVVDDPLAPPAPDPGSPASLVFTTQPTNAISGAAFPTQPVVAVENSSGSVDWNAFIPISLSISSGPTGASLSNCSGSAFYGAVTYSGCSIATAGTYTLVATGKVTNSDGTTTTLTSSPSSSFMVTPDVASQLVWTTEPSNGNTGVALGTQPVVTLEDAYGNPETNTTSSVTLSITGVAGTGGLTCTSTTVAINATTGAASFAGCAISKAGTYYLTAADGSLTSNESNTINVTAGPPTQLAITAVGSATGGTMFNTQPVVTLEDANGNPVSGNTSSVTLSISGGAAGANLTCNANPVSVSTTSGQASFSGCSIDKSSTSSYTLTARDGSYTPATTNLTVSTGPAIQLDVSTSPGATTAGSNFTNQPVVEVQDAGGNVVTSSSAHITLAITSGTGASGAVLSCSNNTVTASAGVADFAGCSINKSSTTSYSLTATASGLAPDLGSTFAINAGTATQLEVNTSPSSASGGTAFSTQPVVDVEDALGNIVTSSNAHITLAITSGTGASGATLNCSNNTVTASAGVADFSGCSINKSSTTSYSLTATASGLTPDFGSTFTVSVGATAQLDVTTSPTSGTGGANFGTQPVVKVEDAGGNVVTGSSAHITLAIASGTGTSGATLSCTANTVTASSGVANFASCAIDKSGTGYTLSATSPGLAADTGSPFNITVGSPQQLDISTSPANAVSGTSFGTQPVVKVEDAGGNVVTSSSAHITFAITSGTGTSGAALSCTTNPVTASSGVANFAGCAINKAGTGYTLSATSSGLTTDTSSSFAVTAYGAASQIQITAGPSGNPVHGTFYAVQVQVQDAEGNVVANNTSQVQLTLGGSGRGTLTCSNSGGTTVNASAGVATFSCSVSKAGSYTITATDGSWSDGASFTMT